MYRRGGFNLGDIQNLQLKSTTVCSEMKRINSNHRYLRQTELSDSYSKKEIVINQRKETKVSPTYLKL